MKSWAWIVLAGWVTGCAPQPAHPWRTTDISGHLPDLGFALTDDQGRAVSQASYRGDVVLLYFGYSGCGTACPVTLARLKSVLKNEGHDVRVLFVTVTPQTDTPAILHAYLSQFDPAHMTGLTGKPSDIEALAKRYRVALPQEAAGPDLTHGTAIYIFDRTGHARLLAGPDDPDAALSHDLQCLAHDVC